MDNTAFQVRGVVGSPYVGRNPDGTTRVPTPRQAVFLCDRMNSVRECLYGGAAGGGKSDALLMAALQYVDKPGYAALILRRTYADLSLPGSIMERAHEWLQGTDAHWSGDTKTWTFPSGATLTFGYLQVSKDKYRYSGSEFQYIAFDESTQFEETDYRFLFSRLRRLKGVKIPIRMRSASNPGGIGHSWVKNRFLTAPLNEETGQLRMFIKSTLRDNPHLDQEEYIQSLMELDPLERRRLLDGDWDAEVLGNKFRRGWVQMCAPASVPWDRLRCIRYWDLASTEPAAGKDPDYTVGVLMGWDPITHWYYILDVVRDRLSPGGVVQLIQETARRDGKAVPIRMEREGGSAGKFTGYQFQGDWLAGYDFIDKASTGSKEIRFNPVSVRMQNYPGTWHVVEAGWNEVYFSELELFPNVDHDDQVDGTSGAYSWLAQGNGGTVTRSYVQRHKAPIVQTGDLTLVGHKYVDKK